ncbi:MAG: CinA family protein [Clostridia bacterium]|nr:CinA family protein [Clostridia bacterium]
MKQNNIPSSSALRASAGRVVRMLAARGETLATAESCTGGLIAKTVTDIAGSSVVFSGACVTYTNEVKMNLLGVDPAIIERESEVSATCAGAMASGVRERLHTTYALSTTGYAGPTGGTEKDPVGTVYIALSTKAGTHRERFSAPNGASRTEVRRAAAMRALELLENALQT